MALTPLLRRFLFRFPPRLVTGWIIRAAHDLTIHLIHRARDLFSDLFELEVLHHVFDLGGDTVAAGNRLTERDCFANHLEVRAACPTIFEIRAGLCAALGTVHDRSPFRRNIIWLFSPGAK